MAYSPIFPFTSAIATSSYVSGAIYVGIRNVDSASFEMVNLGKPIVLFALPASFIPALTASLSASYSSSLGWIGLQ